MTRSKRYLLIRAFSYLLGFVLFYAPFALLQKLLINVFHLTGREDIHGSCFRMGINSLFTGGGLDLATTSGIIVLVILLLAFFIGPVFCGRLCVFGAISEYLSRIVPKKLQINWQKFINPAPVRYGVLAGFILSTFLGASVLCAYCNYSLMQNLILGVTNWDLAVLSSASILTGFIWLIVLGAFAKGGRGFCSYFCPIGATQSLLHFVGAKLGFTYKLKYTKDKCISCKLCVKDCPMGALQFKEDKLEYNIHDCITCNQCKYSCPKGAISFGRGKSGWKENNTKIIKD
jgi:polyferredoxin